LEYLSAVVQPGYAYAANKWRCTCISAITGEEATPCYVGVSGAVTASSVAGLREKTVILNKVRGRKD
jgi:hypothetical protein